MTGDADERFRRDYAPVFLQYLSEGGEGGRRAAYELGRRAIVERLSVLDLARIHHGVLLDVLKTHQSSQELERIAQAASEFLVEALPALRHAEHIGEGGGGCLSRSRRSRTSRTGCACHAGNSGERERKHGLLSLWLRCRGGGSGRRGSGRGRRGRRVTGCGN